MPLPNIPLVSLTGSPNTTQPASTLAAPGQFANLIQTNAPTPNFVQANGSSVTPPSTSQNGPQGSFGAMLPKVSSNTQFGGSVRLQSNTVTPPPINFNTVQLGGAVNPNRINNLPNTQGLSTAALTGANNAQYVYQGLYRPDAEQIRQQQITQLTAPYQGSLAALTGANMIEPTNKGFAGTDPRQPVTVSNQYLTGRQPSSLIGSPDTSGFGGYGRRSYGGGGFGGGYSYSGPRSYSYKNSVVGQILNWRVATG